MPALTRQKITFAEMRTAGARGVLIYCSDYKCSHSTAISADQWPDHVRLSDLDRGLPAKSVARGAPTSVWISIGTRGQRPARHPQPSHPAER